MLVERGLHLRRVWVLSAAGRIRTHGATVADLSAAMMPGPYVFPVYASRGHIRLTNKTPAGTYRAPGRFEATFVRERLQDLVEEEDLSRYIL